MITNIKSAVKSLAIFQNVILHEVGDEGCEDYQNRVVHFVYVVRLKHDTVNFLICFSPWYGP